METSAYASAQGAKIVSLRDIRRNDAALRAAAREGVDARPAGSGFAGTARDLIAGGCAFDQVPFRFFMACIGLGQCGASRLLR